jgi:hypothetical protein
MILASFVLDALSLLITATLGFIGGVTLERRRTAAMIRRVLGEYAAKVSAGDDDDN